MNRLNKTNMESRLTSTLRSLSQSQDPYPKSATRRFSVRFRKKSTLLDSDSTSQHRVSFSDNIASQRTDEPKATLAQEEIFTDELVKPLKVYDLLSSPLLLKKRPLIRRRTSSLDIGHTNAYYKEIASETNIITPKLVPVSTRQRNPLRHKFERLHSITDEEFYSKGSNYLDLN